MRKKLSMLMALMLLFGFEMSFTHESKDDSQDRKSVV